MTATDRDRKTAAGLLADVHSGWCGASPGQAVAHPCHCRLRGIAEAVAAALAAERERVLAPVLAVAEALDAKARQCAVEADELPTGSGRRMGLLGRILGMKFAAVCIRRAAQDGER